MTWLNVAFNNFIGGEVSPDIYGRYDIETYKKSCEALINFLVRAQGPAFFRPGFAYVTHTRLNKFAVLKKFVFNSDEAYVLEFTDQKVRFFRNRVPVTEIGPKKTITGITTAAQGVVTVTSHGYLDGDEICIAEATGITALNGNKYIVSDASTNTFKLKDSTGTYIDTTNMGTYVSGGISMRVCKITSVTIAAQTVLTSAAHGYADGDEVYLYDIIGPDGLNGKSYIISDKTTDTFKLKDVDGNYISTVGLSAYVSGGTCNRVYEIDAPYKESDDLNLLQIAQNADTMYLVHPKYQPRKLTRTSDTKWTLATFAGTLFPFTTVGNYPRAVAFAQGRLWYGGTDTAPDKFWGSRGPQDDGTTRYDDFTTGTSEDNAVVFILASSSGKVEAIRWMGTNNKFLVIGTYGGVSKVTGSSDDYAITATSVNVRQLTTYGCADTIPVVLGNSVYYIQRGKLVLREIFYDIYQDAYVAENRLLLASRIIGEGISRVDFSSGRLDILWGKRTDGALLGMSVNKSENVFGWHRHIVGGDKTVFVEDLVTIPQSSLDDQLWTVTKRTINGAARRYIEYLTDEVLFPEELDFYTGDKEGDIARFANAIFNKQREYKHLDSHLTYDSSSYGKGKSATLTPVFDGDEVTITSNVSVFKSTDIDREIWGVYDNEGVGGGRYKVKAYTSGTVVVCKVLSEPDNKTATLTPGNWYFTTDVVTGLDHLEGETIQVVADGGNHPDVEVTGGKITLDAQHSVIHAGYKYRGIMKSLNIEGGGINGPAQTKNKKITDVNVRLLNTLGASVGSDIYNMEPVLYASTNQLTGRPPQPYSGFKKISINDEWVGDTQDDIETHAVVVQDYPLPCEVQVVDVYFETTNE